MVGQSQQRAGGGSEHGQGDGRVLDEEPEQLLALAQFCLRLLALRDVLGEDDDAAYGSVGGSPGNDFPAEPLHRAAGTIEAVLVGALRLASQAAAACVFPAVRNAGDELAVRMPDNIAIGKSMFLQPSLARGHVKHLAVEHGQGDGRVLDEEPEQFLALAQFRFGLLPFRDVLHRAAQLDGIPISVVLDMSGRSHPCTS